MPYEGSILGYFTVWQGPENNACDSLSIQKRNEVLIGWANDGFHWDREFKRPFMGVSSDFKAWNAGNVQSVAGCPIIVGDSLYFYCSGRYNSKPVHDSNFATGLAILRRDGFVSMHAGAKEGTFVADNIKVDGKYFFVNADVKGKGQLKVELLDEKGNSIPGFTKRNCAVMRSADKTKQQITWKGKKDLSELSGRTIRAKFYLARGDFYAYWVSPWASGESRGYTAGGGPGLHASGMDIK